MQDWVYAIPHQALFEATSLIGGREEEKRERYASVPQPNATIAKSLLIQSSDQVDAVDTFAKVK